MLKGINDSTSDARALIKLMEGIPAKINLILLIHGLDHRMNALKKQIEEFAKIVLKAVISFSSQERQEVTIFWRLVGS